MLGVMEVPSGRVVVVQEVWVAAERAKREAWMAEQTKSIKERTIKGLEPEIQASCWTEGKEGVLGTCQQLD